MEYASVAGETVRETPEGGEGKSSVPQKNLRSGMAGLANFYQSFSHAGPSSSIYID